MNAEERDALNSFIREFRENAKKHKEIRNFLQYYHKGMIGKFELWQVLADGYKPHPVGCIQ